jgi:lipid-binding SYLF domain-containing protein
MFKLYLVIAISMACACGGRQPSPAAQRNLLNDANTTIAEMTARDPGLSPVLINSVAYAVFPDVGAAGAVVGGAYGRGILYEDRTATGLIELKQGSIGLQLGGQTYSELIVLRDPQQIENLKSGELKIGADASAVIIRSGAAAAVRFDHGSEVFVMPRGGLMGGVTISGQSIGYQPLG